MKIEVIDYQSPDAAKQLVKSFRSSGFAVLHNHPIPLQLFKNVQADWERFFACDELKKEFMFDRNAYPQDGYFPTESAKGQKVDDLKEFFHIYRNAPTAHAVGDNSWQLFDASFAIGQTVMNWLDQETPDEVKAHFSCPLLDMMDPLEQTLLRVIHYPPLQGGEQAGAIRAAAHHDINLVTILPSAEEPGLQVLDLQGNWIDVPADPGMVVVNSGEMLNISSKGYYPATTHRVCNPSAERMQHARYSFPLFVHAKSQVIIDTENELSQYDLLTQRFADLGLK